VHHQQQRIEPFVHEGGSFLLKLHMKFHNLWPIPQTEIDANQGADLKQNTGY
jgi:hypothetical protein